MTFPVPLITEFSVIVPVLALKVKVEAPKLIPPVERVRVPAVEVIVELEPREIAP